MSDDGDAGSPPARKKVKIVHQEVDNINPTTNNYFIKCISRHEIYGGHFNIPLNQRLGTNGLLIKKIHESFSLRRQGIYDNDDPDVDHGSIYNLCFSPNGHTLVAASEKKALLLFDPLNHKRTFILENAHQNSLNFIKFLDSDTLFATCSDDNTINLWDLRQMKRRLRSLIGHTHWVKNLEFDSKKKVVISSGYDGAVKVWDIFDQGMDGASIASQEHEEVPCSRKTILQLSCLTRMRMTNDHKKMIISTSEGYILLIHDLDVDTLESDLRGFQSDLYNMMQKRTFPGSFDFGSWHNPLFKANRNRVELISDFPNTDDANIITSMDVHPNGQAVLSRNKTHKDDAEWTCVHSIKDDVKPSELVPLEVQKNPLVHCYDFPSRFLNSSQSPDTGTPSSSSSGGISTVTEGEDSPDMSPVIIISTRSLTNRANATILNPIHYRQVKDQTKTSPFLYKNLKRLTHYHEEANVGHGFNKELSFSPDGRLIVSPFEYGFRILAFDNQCNEMNMSKSSKLAVIKTVLPHPNYVVTTKFSPTHHLIASGCLSGRIAFSHPMIQ